MTIKANETVSKGAGRVPHWPGKEYDTLPRVGRSRKPKVGGYGACSARRQGYCFPGDIFVCAKQSHSKHQQRIIKNYYENRGAISLQRLGELVTDLYLAEGKARSAKWKQAVAALEKLGVAPQRIALLREKDNPAMLAKVVEELMAKQDH